MIIDFSFNQSFWKATFCQGTFWNSVVSYSSNSSVALAPSHFPPTKPNFVTRLPWTYSSIHHLLSVYLTAALPPSFLHSLPLQCFGRSPVAMKRSQQWPLSVREHRSKRDAYLMMAWCNKGKHTVSFLNIFIDCGSLFWDISDNQLTPRRVTSPLYAPLWVVFRQSLQCGSVSHRTLLRVCSHSGERVDLFICWQLFVQTFVRLADLLVRW